MRFARFLKLIVDLVLPAGLVFRERKRALLRQDDAGAPLNCNLYTRSDAPNCLRRLLLTSTRVNAACLRGVSIRKTNNMSSSNTSAGAFARFKGLIWVAVAIGAVVTIIALAPIISHNF